MKKLRSRKSSRMDPGSRHGRGDPQLAGKLMRQFRKRHPNADPYAFRDEVERMFHRALTLRIKGKRKGSLEVTIAVGMWRRQLAQIRRGERKAVSWVYIASKCYPDFRSLPEPERQRLLDRLENAVHNRNHRAAKRAREKTNKRLMALAGPETG